MKNLRFIYKSDDYGSPMHARVAWRGDGSTQKPQPIALIYHAGGLVLGDSETVPQAQIDYLATHGFVVVIPEYRLLPQVTAETIFGDCEEAHTWATNILPIALRKDYNIDVDATKVVALGHSSGGTIALHQASRNLVKAATAICAALFISDTSTSAYQPTTTGPFGSIPDFTPTETEWAEISPKDRQLTAAPFIIPGQGLSPRTRWQAHIFKNGLWPKHLAPDGDLKPVDPMVHIHSDWPPTMIIHGEQDFVPGRNVELVQRAEKELKAGGVRELEVHIVPNAGHLFDHPDIMGTEDIYARWQIAVKGLDWLVNHA